MLARKSDVQGLTCQGSTWVVVGIGKVSENPSKLLTVL